jgi:hypothetical protein
MPVEKPTKHPFLPFYTKPREKHETMATRHERNRLNDHFYHSTTDLNIFTIVGEKNRVTKLKWNNCEG